MRLRDLLVVASVFIALVPKWCDAASIDFEDLPVDTGIGKKYASKGVEFVAAFIDIYDGHRMSPQPHSGTKMAHQFPAEFSTEPMTLQFKSAQNHVQFYGCSAEGNTIQQGTAKAFDAETGGSLIAQDGPKALTTGVCSTLFELRTASPLIRRVEFSVMSSYLSTPTTIFRTDIAMDDLMFEGNPPPPVPTSPPNVLITAPNGETVDAAMYKVIGTVTGDGLPANLILKIDHSRAPGDLTPPDFWSIALTGTGNSRAFSQSVRLHLGSMVFTAVVENSGGLDGSAVASLMNLPASLRDNSGSLGKFQWALPGGDCNIAVYANGALASVGNNTFQINPPILNKWEAWVQARSQYVGSPSMFCPTENAHVALGGTFDQSFHGGRIYTDPGGTYIVPAVFAQAIDILGGEAGTGVPQGDPQASPSAHTWVFQHFVRPQGGLPSTMEIKGSPPQLFVERQGGDLSILTKSAKLSLTPATATLVDSFSCSGPYGPCAVQQSTPNPPVARAGDRFCNGTTFSMRSPSPVGTDEWVPILPNGHTTPVQMMGWVSDSHYAGMDDAATHEFTYTHPDGQIWSDWNVLVYPLEPFLGLLASNTKLELEFEYYSAQGLFVFYNGQPLPGDLYFAAGRWIIDCGHDDFSSEIHPPFVTARIRTVPNAGVLGPKTEALIWVNGYYYAGPPVEVLLFPPPRPTPNSFLAISMPKALDAAVDVNAIDPLSPDLTDPDFAAFVRARFWASAKPVNIAWGGLLPFRRGRVYEGTWTVGWEQEPEYRVSSIWP